MWDQQGKQVCQGQQALDGAIEIIPFPAVKNTKKRHALSRISARNTQIRAVTNTARRGKKPHKTKTKARVMKMMSAGQPEVLEMLDFHDFGACCWILMILKKMLDFDDFGACCWILMILKQMPDCDDFGACCWILMILKHCLKANKEKATDSSLAVQKISAPG